MTERRVEKMIQKENCPPLIGERFPDVEVRTTLGKRKLPDDYEGKWLVLFSHPGDFTPVCTTEFISIQRKSEEFKALNTELIGLSIDGVFSHMKWVEWIRDYFQVTITFPIIADELGELAKKLGMISPEVGPLTVRTVYIIDPKGRIRLMMNYPPEVGRNSDELLRVLKALQTATEHKVATPANWPYNEYLGEQVMIPPPSNFYSVQKRLEEAKLGNVHCLDWWFCYKSLNK
jgi:peroxiredoxin 2/4